MLVDACGIYASPMVVTTPDDDPVGPPEIGKIDVAWVRCDHGTNDQDKWVLHARVVLRDLVRYVEPGWQPGTTDFTSTYVFNNNFGSEWTDAARNQYFECIVVDGYIVFSCKHADRDALRDRYPFLGSVRGLTVRNGRKDQWANDRSLKKTNGVWKWTHSLDLLDIYLWNQVYNDPRANVRSFTGFPTD